MMGNKDARAMVFEKVAQPFIAQGIELPSLQEEELLVEIVYTTICSSDLHTFYGRRKAHCPSILGHEIIGKVVDIARTGVLDYYGKPLEVGDRVTWSVYAHDHSGLMAQKGIPQKSDGLFKYGHEELDESQSLSGGFATHCHLRAGTDIFKLPDNLTPKEATPLNCTHATIAGAIRLAGDLKGKNVLIVGAGMLGLSACAMSKEAGAKRVFAMDIAEERLGKSLKFGADEHYHATLPVEILQERLAPLGGIDVLIETSGMPVAMEKGIELLNIGGINIWVGAVFAQRDLAINAEKIVRNILTIKGLHNYIPQDLATAIRFLSANRHKYPFEQLVGLEFPLHQLDQAFQTADNKGHYRVGIYPNR